MKRRKLLVSSLAGIATYTVSGCIGGSSAPTVPDNADVPGYEIKSTGDIGDAATTHIERNVVVSSVGDMTDEDLRLVALDNVADVTDGQTVDAVTVFVYEEGDDIGGAAEARIEWAPEGDIAQTDTVAAGNYDEYEFSVERIGF